MRAALLVIGYGNELRGDDAVGPRIARAVAGWGLPGLAVHQLTPELAEPLSRAENAVFVDAGPGADAGVTAVELSAGARPGSGHVSDPQWLLALTEAVHGRRPRAWLITVPASRFDPGEGLSPRAERGMQEALEKIREVAAGVCGSGPRLCLDRTASP